MSTKIKPVILVHGWSVHNTSTYGELPARLEAESNDEIMLDVRNIWLGKYVSFQDEVQLDDISKAFESAIRNEFDDALLTEKCVCITHSTGGPVIRNWVYQYYARKGKMDECPVSHLIMLAPANFGSALAVLGKMRLSRIKSWLEGIQPGKGVLDWLELGSPESWDLNTKWMNYFREGANRESFFLFVISGQSIDRSFYDHVNSYTGELGSDGVVRLAGANLNANYYKYRQVAPTDDEEELALTPIAGDHIIPDETAFAVAEGRSHSGDTMGILKSIKQEQDAHPTVKLILDCIRVNSPESYANTCRNFEAHSAEVFAKELVETEDRFLLSDRYFIHDPYSMVIFRIRDEYGQAIGNYDIIFTGGENDSENQLPENFLMDKQRNSRAPGNMTFYFNASIMLGSDPVVFKDETIRKQLPGAGSFGFRIVPFTDKGFVHFLPAVLRGTPDNLEKFIIPNQTTLIDVEMKRIVHEGVFQLTTDRDQVEFKNVEPGKALTE
jgi:pimeloyl-ACP methyl ester carboxylesterase